jgi:hypothetical protein
MANERRAGVADMPAEGKARLKAGLCTSEFRMRFEQNLKD